MAASLGNCDQCSEVLTTRKCSCCGKRICDRLCYERHIHQVCTRILHGTVYFSWHNLTNVFMPFQLIADLDQNQRSLKSYLGKIQSTETCFNSLASKLNETFNAVLVAHKALAEKFKNQMAAQERYVCISFICFVKSIFYDTRFNF